MYIYTHISYMYVCAALNAEDDDEQSQDEYRRSPGLLLYDLGWRYLSNATCLIRLCVFWSCHGLLCYAYFGRVTDFICVMRILVVSRTIVICNMICHF